MPGWLIILHVVGLIYLLTLGFLLWKEFRK